jgi:hypothetical protein
MLKSIIAKGLRAWSRKEDMELIILPKAGNVSVKCEEICNIPLYVGERKRSNDAWFPISPSSSNSLLVLVGRSENFKNRK